MRSFTFILTGKTTAARQLILGLLLVMETTILSAQQKTISGVVKDATNNSPVPKATVQVKGTNRGTTTDENGEFIVQANANESLVISAIGFVPLEQKVGSTTEFNFRIAAETKEMEAVVVTALGISRQQKALGYSAQQVNAEDVNDARSNNWSSALSGKVAGLQLLSAGSGPVNSARVTLRGDISLNPNNNNAS